MAFIVTALWTHNDVDQLRCSILQFGNLGTTEEYLLFDSYSAGEWVERT